MNYKNKKYIVYMHIFPNGKKYIGITSKKPNGRWENGTGYDKEHQPVMYNAIQKYGWENVEHIILYRDLSYEEANQIEMDLIKEYKTNCKRYGDDYGYNMTDGGDGNKGHKLSKEAIEKMRQLKLGKTGKDCPNSRPVICDGIEYESLTDFRQKMDYPKGNFVGWLNGKVGMPKYWYDKKLHYKDTDFDTIIKLTKRETWCAIEYDGKIFESQKALADYLNVSPSTLCNWLKGKSSIPKEFADKGLKRIYDDAIPTKEYTPKGRKTKVLFDGKIYNSQVELAKELGIKKGTLWSYLRGIVKMPKEYKDKNLHIIEE